MSGTTLHEDEGTKRKKDRRKSEAAQRGSGDNTLCLLQAQSFASPSSTPDCYNGFHHHNEPPSPFPFLLPRPNTAPLRKFTSLSHRPPLETT
mmetsp:Transcript_19006/g.38770  ORF Transcript_19006/g.38770 Transcript_19006/m.38770 type:complete len:92 (+) Transcript_19006:160-435(+)